MRPCYAKVPCLSTFSYDATTLPQAEQWLSTDRLTKYMKAANGDLEAAIKLHVHNTALSAAFFGPVQVFEIALRNAFHRELSNHFGPTWHDEAAFLVDQDIVLNIDNCKNKLASMKMPVDTPHIVAELHFGFWTSLTAGHYEHSIWTPAISKAFPNYWAITGKRLKRSTASGQLTYLRAFRNRIAHHEPIFHRALVSDYRTILSVSSWMHAGLDSWIEHHSRVSHLLPRRELY